MAKKKITDLTLGSTPLSGSELLEMVQNSGSYKITSLDIASLGKWNYSTIVNTTSGTSVTLISDLPSNVLEIEVLLNSVSTNTNSQPPILRLGDAGGVETTGYSGVIRGTNGSSSITSGFYALRPQSFSASDLVKGVMRLVRWDTSLHLWFADGIFNDSSDYSFMSGTKTTSEALTSLFLTTPGGTATFNAGSARVRYKTL